MIFSDLQEKAPAPRNQTELQSQVLDALRIPLILFILFTHTNPQFGPFYTPVASIDFLHLTGRNLYSLLSRTGNLLGFMAVPFFFFTSGYFFFYKTAEWNRTVYLGKIKKRLTSLLMPYLLWNGLCLILNILHDGIKCVSKGMPADKVADFLDRYGNLSHLLDFFWKSSIWDIGSTNLLGFKTWMTGPIVLPFWFLRDLIIISLLSPLIYRMVKWGKGPLLCLLGLAYLLRMWTIPGLNVTAIFFFSFGAYLSLNGRNVVDTFYPYRKAIGALAVLCLLAAAVLDVSQWNPVLSNAFCLTGMITAINVTAYGFGQGRFVLRPKLAQTTFFVYALHGLLIGRFSFLGSGMKVADALFRGKECLAGAFLSYLTAPLFGLFFCLLLFFLMKRYTPSLLRPLIGGRL